MPPTSPPAPATDPFDRIPDADDGEYAGTELETQRQRERRTVRDEDVTFPRDSSPSTPLDDWDW